MKSDYPTLQFSTASDWGQWLSLHGTEAQGVHMRLFKKNSGVASISYAEALDTALCYGWIDGKKRSEAEASYLQTFTPRRKNSLWSKRNIEHVERLTALGLMQPNGIFEVERAKSDGRLAAAYDPQSEMTTPPELERALTQNSVAREKYLSLSRSAMFQINFKVQTARSELTKLRRIEQIIRKLEEVR